MFCLYLCFVRLYNQEYFVIVLYGSGQHIEFSFQSILNQLDTLYTCVKKLIIKIQELLSLVTICGKMDPCITRRGVPQGSALRPIALTHLYTSV